MKDLVAGAVELQPLDNVAHLALDAVVAALRREGPIDYGAQRDERIEQLLRICRTATATGVGGLVGG